MGANADVLRRSDLIGSTAQETEWPRFEDSCETNGWNPEDFAREQIRGLVRRVFFTGAVQPANRSCSARRSRKQMWPVFAIRWDGLWHWRRAATLPSWSANRGQEKWFGLILGMWRTGVIKSWSTQIGNNLWRVPGFGLRKCREESGTRPYWLSCLAGLRIEFEYAVIHGPVAGISSEAAVLGHLADGIILVLGAHSTRRATARKIKETLEASQARILGTVLSGRMFPVPERIYRRL